MTILFLPWVLLFPQEPSTEEAPPSDENLEETFADTVAADQAEAEAEAAAAPPAPVTPANALNPEISLIATLAASVWTHEVAPSFRAEDDPAGAGFTAQELELTFAADVDPFFKMRAFLTIPNMEGIEIEEAYLLSTSLPESLQLKAGLFRSSFGRNNEQHLHQQTFARRPQTTRLLGVDGLRSPGAPVTWRSPRPRLAGLNAEALTVDGGEKPSFVASLEQFFPLSQTWGVLVGLGGAALLRGEGGHAHEGEEPMMMEEGHAHREYLVGADVYLKWNPANVAQSYAWVALTGEIIGTQTAGEPHWDWVTYAQLDARVARRWQVGARVDLVGYPSTEHIEREIIAAGSVTFLPSEYSRVRFTVEHDHHMDDPDRRNQRFILQLEGAIGAHQAHTF